MLVDLNAAFIQEPAGHWGTKSHLWWGNLCEMVCDINTAYDCAGLPRPYISYGNYEYVDDGVHWYTICDEVKLAFKDELEELGMGGNSPIYKDIKPYERDASSAVNIS